MTVKRQAHCSMPKSHLNYSKLSTSGSLHTTVHISNTVNETILETKLKLSYDFTSY